MIINLIADSVSSSSMPTGFMAAMQTAANMLGSAIAGNYTVNITVGWGSFNNVLDPSMVGVGGAEGGPDDGNAVSYATIKGWLANSAVSADDAAAIASLPANVTSLPAAASTANIYVASAQERAMGVFTGANSTIDGSIEFGTAVGSQNWISVALHELTHALGRFGGDSSFPSLMDLFRYGSSGTYQWTGGQAAYFSLNKGVTDLANYSTSSDYGDFANDALDGYDSFDAYYSNSTFSALTTVDKRLMDAIGFTRSAAHDFTGDGTSDLVLQSGGAIIDWTLRNGIATSGHTLGAGLTGWTAVGGGDFNADGVSDILLQNGSSVVDWMMSNGVVSRGVQMGSAGAYSVVGEGDFNGDGVTDVLLQSGGNVIDWLVQNGVATSGKTIGSNLTGWRVAGAGDFNNDGTSDVLLQNGNSVVVWDMANGAVKSTTTLGNAQGYSVVATGDFNGDGTTDVLLQSGGSIIDWIVVNNVATSGHVLGSGLTGWSVVGTGDYNGNGVCDIALQNGASVVDWAMLNGAVASGCAIGSAGSCSVKL